ncbi:hypothetical protein K502DRAFT_129640 [Neoconidiobolus thromboides FSU 785]|nr:hypothetical protein K502DRAFT_129640 [Neoconidiobolus thromboides FSU 785]
MLNLYSIQNEKTLLSVLESNENNLIRLYNDFVQLSLQEKKGEVDVLIKKIAAIITSKLVAVLPIVYQKINGEQYNELVLKYLTFKDNIYKLIKDTTSSEFHKVEDYIKDYFSIFRIEKRLIMGLSLLLSPEEMNRIIEYFIYMRDNVPLQLHPLI